MDKFPAILQGPLRRHLQSAAAGNLHACDSNALDVIVSQDGSQFLGIVNAVKLGATHQRHLAAHELLVEIGVGVGRAVRCDQQLRPIEIRSIDGSQLNLDWPVL